MRTPKKYPSGSAASSRVGPPSTTSSTRERIGAQTRKCVPSRVASAPTGCRRGSTEWVMRGASHGAAGESLCLPWHRLEAGATSARTGRHRPGPSLTGRRARSGAGIRGRWGRAVPPPRGGRGTGAGPRTSRGAACGAPRTGPAAAPGGSGRAEQHVPDGEDAGEVLSSPSSSFVWCHRWYSRADQHPPERAEVPVQVRVQHDDEDDQQRHETGPP